MSTLSSSVGRDVDGGVGDEQQLRIGRHVHDEDVADAPDGAHAALAADDRGHQLVGVQAALHQRRHLAGAHHLHGAGGGGVAVRRDRRS